MCITSEIRKIVYTFFICSIILPHNYVIYLLISFFEIFLGKNMILFKNKYSTDRDILIIKYLELSRVEAPQSSAKYLCGLDNPLILLIKYILTYM